MRSIIFMLLVSSSAFAAETLPHDHHAPVPVPVPANSHKHAEHAGATAEMGKRWPADAPLRHGMQQIRSARAQTVHSTADAVALATAIDDAIAYMIRNCSLPADADAALHGVIGQLGGAASALRGEKDSQLAITTVDTALARYAELFDETNPR